MCQRPNSRNLRLLSWPLRVLILELPPRLIVFCDHLALICWKMIELFRILLLTNMFSIPISKIFGLFSSSYKLYYCKKLLMSVIFFLLLEHQHKVMSKTRLHHDPIHSTWHINIILWGVVHIIRPNSPGRLISVARNTMSSPCNVVIDLWTCIKCAITWKIVRVKNGNIANYIISIVKS